MSERLSQKITLIIAEGRRDAMIKKLGGKE